MPTKIVPVSGVNLPVVHPWSLSWDFLAILFLPHFGLAPLRRNSMCNPCGLGAPEVGPDDRHQETSPSHQGAEK